MVVEVLEEDDVVNEAVSVTLTVEVTVTGEVMVTVTGLDTVVVKVFVVNAVLVRVTVTGGGVLHPDKMVALRMMEEIIDIPI